MKEIPKRQKIGNKVRDIQDLQGQEIKKGGKKANKPEPQNLKKTKSIRRQPSKTIKECKKLEQKKLIENQKETKDKAQDALKKNEKPKAKKLNMKQTEDSQKKLKTSPKRLKGGRRDAKNKKSISQEHNLSESIAPIEHLIGDVQLNQQKINETLQAPKQKAPKNIEKCYIPFTVIKGPHEHLYLGNPSIGISQEKLNSKPEITELTYYGNNNSDENIFDVLIPMGSIDEQISIFNKNRQPECEQLLEKIHGRTTSENIGPNQGLQQQV